MSESRRSARTARFTSLEFEPLRPSGRVGPSGRVSRRVRSNSRRLRGRPSNETQRLTPLQADLLGEVRAVRGHSARLGGRLPLQPHRRSSATTERGSGGISVRLVRAVSGRIAQPLRKLTHDERFLARWTLLLSAVSAPLAMLSFTVLIGLDLPVRRAASAGATQQPAERAPIAPQHVGAALLANSGATPSSAKQHAAPAVRADFGFVGHGVGELAARAASDRLAEGHETPLRKVGSVAAGVSPAGPHPEDLALAAGGYVAGIGTPGATRNGTRQLPVTLYALERSWRSLTLEVEFPEAWRLLEIRMGQVLQEAGAVLRAAPRPGGATLTIVRPEHADPVGDGEVAVLELEVAPGGGDVQVRVVSATEATDASPAVAHVQERRLVLD